LPGRPPPPTPLLLTIQTLGIDNVLFAADYPFETVATQ